MPDIATGMLYKTRASKGRFFNGLISCFNNHE